MKTKKIAIIIMAVAFLVAVLFAVFFAFSVNSVSAEFSICENVVAEDVQKKLDKYKGENILFFDTEELATDLKANPYVEVLSVEKQFPNVIKVSIKERIEWFALKYEDKVVYISEKGVALREISVSDYTEQRDKVELNLNGLNVLSVELGKKVVTEDDELFYTVMEMAKSVNLADIVKKITINKDIENNQAVFSVYSGVDIVVQKADDCGIEKITAAFDVYDGKVLDRNGNFITDYQKFTSSISVYKLDTGEIRVTFIAPKGN